MGTVFRYIVVLFALIAGGNLSAASIHDFDLSSVPEHDEAASALRSQMLAVGTEIKYRTESPKQKLWIFQPDDLQPGDQRPCLFFIHGGGWGGTPASLAAQCLYFAQRGMVTVSIHFRGPKEPKGSGSPKTSLADARSAYRWVREHAAEYGIDPTRIVVSGGSAGGHLALSLVTIELPGIDNNGDNLATPIDPQAFILFNPVIDLVDGWAGGQKKCHQAGLDPATFSPAHFVKPGIGDTLILSGSEDPLITPDQIHAFTKRMEGHGNHVTFIEYPDVGHAFFNFGREQYKGAYFIPTCEAAEAFLTERGFIP